MSVPSQMSREQGLVSAVHAVPADFLASAGQTIAPPQVSATSHSPAAARHSVLAGIGEQVPTLPELLQLSQGPALHAALQHTPSAQKPLTHSLVPLHSKPMTFLLVHTPPEQYWLLEHWESFEQPPQIEPLQVLGEHDCVTGSGHAALLPGQLAANVARSLLQLAVRQDDVEVLNMSAGQLLFAPSQVSGRSHTPLAARQVVALPSLPSEGQVSEEPVQVSTASQMPAAARQVAPALPGACAQEGLVMLPLHASVEHGLPSSLHGVPAGFTPLVGQSGELPLHCSGKSHSLEAVLQTRPALPALWTQLGLPTAPLHTSVVQGLPSSEHAVFTGLTVSAGQLGPLPVQLSARSHSLPAGRHTVVVPRNESVGQVRPEPSQYSA